MRKLASIRRIKDIQPIEGADAIEVAIVDGWHVVVKKNEYRPRDLAIYLEIDSWVPHDLAPFLSKNKEPREYNGVEGERLRTVKLRGQVSQGLLLPINELFERMGMVYDVDFTTHPGGYMEFENGEPVRLWEEGTDLTEILGIQKWEPPIPAQMQGQVKGTFPTHLIPKTDQERIQNCFDELDTDALWEVTLKLDGSSCTIFNFEQEVRVCSRNMELKINEENADNTFVKMANKLAFALKNFDGLALQGELMGPGVQGNRENFPEHRFYVFDVYDIAKQEYLDPQTRRKVVEVIKQNTEGDIFNHAPVLHDSHPTPDSVDDGLMEYNDIKSINHKIGEGVVYKNIANPTESFKIISNKFLLKGGN